MMVKLCLCLEWELRKFQQKRNEFLIDNNCFLSNPLNFHLHRLPFIRRNCNCSNAIRKILLVRHQGSSIALFVCFAFLLSFSYVIYFAPTLLIQFSFVFSNPWQYEYTSNPWQYEYIRIHQWTHFLMVRYPRSFSFSCVILGHIIDTSLHPIFQTSHIHLHTSQTAELRL